MILKSYQVIKEIEDGERSKSKDPLVITPLLRKERQRLSGAASMDLRLGCWFLVGRPGKIGIHDIYTKGKSMPSETKLSKSFFVPFGDHFIIQPHAFILGITLEWIRLPCNRAAYVIGKSSWGRHGLIIATATGVHPGFTGCLTLELANIGDIPVTIKPGTRICQLFIHSVESSFKGFDKSSFMGMRKPQMGSIKVDEIAKKLALSLDSKK